MKILPLTILQRKNINRVSGKESEVFHVHSILSVDIEEKDAINNNSREELVMYQDNVRIDNYLFGIANKIVYNWNLYFFEKLVFICIEMAYSFKFLKRAIRNAVQDVEPNFKKTIMSEHHKALYKIIYYSSSAH